MVIRNGLQRVVSVITGIVVFILCWLISAVVVILFLFWLTDHDLSDHGLWTREIISLIVLGALLPAWLLAKRVAAQLRARLTPSDVLSVCDNLPKTARQEWPW